MHSALARRQVTPLGADKPEAVDVRIVRATYLDESALFEPQRQLSELALDALQRDDWHGNVRALRQACERAVILAIGQRWARHCAKPPATSARPRGCWVWAAKSMGFDARARAAAGALVMAAATGPVVATDGSPRWQVFAGPIGLGWRALCLDPRPHLLQSLPASRKRWPAACSPPAVAGQHLSLGGDETRLLAMQPIESALEAEHLHAWRQLTHVLTHEIMNSLMPIASLSHTAQGLLSLMADPVQLEQALLNLIKNSAEATADTRVPSLAQRARLVRGGRLLLEVRDNAPGVPPGLECDIFCPFSAPGRRAPASASPWCAAWCMAWAVRCTASSQCAVAQRLF